MSTIEIIIAGLVLIAIVGQFLLVRMGRNKTLFDPKHSAKKRAELIEREFDKQNGDSK